MIRVVVCVCVLLCFEFDGCVAKSVPSSKVAPGEDDSGAGEPGLGADVGMRLAVADEGVAGSGVPCRCEWVAGYRDGEFPDTGVDFGSGDFIVRVRVGADWLPGRLTPTNQTAYMPGGGFTSTTYEVLTNPENCVLTWTEVKASDASLKRMAVAADPDPSSPPFYVARGQLEEFTIGGLITNDTYEGRFVLDNRIIFSRDVQLFEILQSEYPALEATLSDFEFELRLSDYDAMPGKSTHFLFGIEEMVNDVNISTKTTIRHEQVFEEHFQLSETTFFWTGLRSVDAKVQLWCGSPLLSFTTQLEKGQTKLSESREREVSVVKEVTETSAGGVQICSSSVILKDYPIQFTATADLKAENMSGEQVGRILRGTGRDDCTEFGESNCKAKVSGSLTGKYVIRVKSISSELNPDFPCREEMLKA